MNTTRPEIVRWLLDTRSLWAPGDTTLKTKDLPEIAPVSFSFLSADEKKAVLKYYFIKDAKLSLASHLMKHLAISRLCGVPWDKTAIGPDKNKKPCHKSASGEPAIDFNVSHQAGIVALVACTGISSDVGIDVVCVNERNEYAMIDKDGLFSWIDIHEDVFSPYELDYLKHDTENLSLPQITSYPPKATEAIKRCQRRDTDLGFGFDEGSNGIHITSKIVIEAKLRRFYALWCLKEAYIKMSGEALLADWLRELEFRGFRAPVAKSGVDKDDASTPGEVIRDVHVYLKGQRISNICIELVAFGQNYMVGTAIRLNNSSTNSAELELPSFINLQLEDELRALETSRVA